MSRALLLAGFALCVLVAPTGCSDGTGEPIQPAYDSGPSDVLIAPDVPIASDVLSADEGLICDAVYYLRRCGTEPDPCASPCPQADGGADAAVWWTGTCGTDAHGSCYVTTKPDGGLPDVALGNDAVVWDAQPDTMSD